MKFIIRLFIISSFTILLNIVNTSAQTILVDDFGAVGDGVTDDRAAIQSAIWNLKSNGGTMQFTSGKTYIISSGLNFYSFPVTDDYLVTTTGLDKATIKIQDGAALSWNHWGFRLSESRNITIKNLIIDGNRDTRNPIIETSGCDVLFIDGASDGTRLIDLDLINSPMDNIYIVVHENQGQTQMTDFEMYHCILDNAFRNNMSIISGENFRIIGCEFNNANGTDPQSGIDFEPNSGSTNGYTNMTVEGCLFKDNVRYGVELTYVKNGDGSSIIKNNTFENNGILIGSKENEIHHNTFINQDHQHLHGDATRDGILYFHANGNGIANNVYNNYFYDNHMPAGSHLVNFMYNSGGNNHLHDNYGYGNIVNDFVLNNTWAGTPAQILSNNTFMNRREVGYWTMDNSDVSGNMINDLSDFDNDGTLINTPSSITGKLNEALDFSPDNKYIEIDTSNSLNIQMNITLSAWINWDGINASETQQVFLGRADDWRFGINDGGQVGFYSAASSDTSYTAGWVRASIGDAIPQNEWKFVSYTYDGRVAKVYIDGVVVANKQAYGVLGTNLTKLFIGSFSGNTYSFNGIIDEVKIHNYAMNKTEIEQLMGINYYVDFTSGNDASNGTTPSTAFKNVDKINDLTFRPGDSILFKRGEVWKEDRLYIENVNGSPSSDVVYSAYGTGPKPILSSVVLQSHTWTDLGGNIWEATNPPVEHPERMLINGTEKLRANIQSELDGITYDWRYDVATNDLFIYSTINPNGATTIEYSMDFPMIVGYSEHVTIQNLDIQGGWTGIFINTLSKNITLDSLDVGKYCREGLIINTGSITASEYPQKILVENCNFDAHFAFDYSTAGTYSGSSDRGCSDGIRPSALNSGVIRNCYFKNWGHASIGLDGGSLLKVSDVTIHDNYLTSPDICYGGRLGVDESNNCEIYNNQIVNTSVQSQLNGQNNHYHHNIFNGTTNSLLVPSVIDAGIELQGYTSVAVSNNIYENNLIINTEGPGFRISGNNEHDIFDNIIRNNIIFNCGSDASDIGITIEADLFEETYNNSFLNNLVFNSTTTQTCNYRGAVSDVVGFNNLSGSDGFVMISNISDDPLFVDAPNDDYHKTNNSPCIDNGTDALSTIDYEGTPLSLFKNSDIGIYEFGVYWNGTVNYNWHLSNNWSNGIVPTSTDSVTIPSPTFYRHYPKVSSHVQIKKLYLNGNDNMIIEDNINFDVID